MSPRILIADDDPVHRRHLEASINSFGYEAETLADTRTLLGRLGRQAATDGPAIDLLLLDLGLAGLDLGAVVAELRPQTPVIVQTTSDAIAGVPAALRAGAYDFVVVPVGGERLSVAIKNALRAAALEAEVRRLDRKATSRLSFEEIGGTSTGMDRVVKLGERAARSAFPVLLEGEAGTGKETVARAIHGASDRRGRAFVRASCETLPENDAVAALFGREKGANGTERYVGKLAEAQGGTFFLDEVGALPHEAQGLLLRALQTGEVESLGAKRPSKIDVRFVFATSRNLIELVKLGRFREDLYYRLNICSITVPPLRARREDIAGLARAFCARFAAEEGKVLRGIGAEALALLERYDWPGNVRQLENALYRAVILAEDDELTIAEFPQIAARVADVEIRIPPAPLPAAPLARGEKEFVRVEVRDPNVVPLLDEIGQIRGLDRLEADAIRFALAHYRGRLSAMARGLGIGRSTLYRKLKEHGLWPPRPEEAGDSPVEPTTDTAGRPLLPSCNAA